LSAKAGSFSFCETGELGIVLGRSNLSRQDKG
jgi:hypothetical protein